jgi:hypothetical protein
MVKTAYTKKVILEKYKKRKDLLNVLLKDNKMYTLEKVDILIENFLKRKVK